jgi:ATP-dependent helicase HepA
MDGQPPPFTSGQRWISETEPELGLGTVLTLEQDIVALLFPATGETRRYAILSAPLKRVRFRAGDTIETGDGRVFTVTSVEEKQGLLFYHAAEELIPESELNAALALNAPEERLRSGQADSLEEFDLRYEMLEKQHRIRKSAIRGFAGARMDLIPHQLYIAHEVTSRHAPRVLLADEVGLGKTIEACLILHRLLLTRRAERILILLPESLIHQWFVELLRRFNLWFHIFDEERCHAIEEHHPEENPFLDDQLILCDLHFLSENPRRQEQALAAGWDLLVVDEAHHLRWSPGAPSPEYETVRLLGEKTPGLLLLTAVPEQLGPLSHFARLRLLDPARYPDYDRFIEESSHFRQTARAADNLLKNQPLTPSDAETLARIFSRDPGELSPRLQAVRQGDSQARTELLQDLLDRHGTGRVLFRNTRAAISGFPKRIAHGIRLPRTEPELLSRLTREFEADLNERAPGEISWDFSRDPRIDWLARFLRELAPGKLLLICKTREKVLAIEEALRFKINLKAALFHEDLTLIQRDRNAAWFAEEDGAQLLISSEIGSEGRNFQFAHHLALFDLPSNPEWLEQRIGRLDRIGQSSTVHIHFPYVAGSPQEILFRWCHEGLNAFEHNLQGGNEMEERFFQRVKELALQHPDNPSIAAPASGAKTAPKPARNSDPQTALNQLIADTKKTRLLQVKKLEEGRDRLLELNSFRPGPAEAIRKHIEQWDQDRTLDEFMLRVFDHYNIQVEELGRRTYQLGSHGVFADAFPGLPQEGMTLTCDRALALAREEIGFLTWDHPLVRNAFDQMLGSQQGNSAWGIWDAPGPQSILLESVFLLEPMAPPHLEIDRYLPPTPLRVMVNHQLQNITSQHPPGQIAPHLKEGRGNPFFLHPDLTHHLLPRMLDASQRLAENQSQSTIQTSLASMEQDLGHEINRLHALKQINPAIRDEEIQLAESQRADLRKHLASARLRLDALRLIWKQDKQR